MGGLLQNRRTMRPPDQLNLWSFVSENVKKNDMHCDLGKAEVIEIMVTDSRTVNEICVNSIFRLKNNFMITNY